MYATQYYYTFTVACSKRSIMLLYSCLGFIRVFRRLTEDFFILGLPRAFSALFSDAFSSRHCGNAPHLQFSMFIICRCEVVHKIFVSGKLVQFCSAIQFLTRQCMWCWRGILAVSRKNGGYSELNAREANENCVKFTEKTLSKLYYMSVAGAQWEKKEDGWGCQATEHKITPNAYAQKTM